MKLNLTHYNLSDVMMERLQTDINTLDYREHSDIHSF